MFKIYRALRERSCCWTSRMSLRFHSPLHVLFPVTQTRDEREAGVTVQHVAVADKDVDTAAQLAAGLDEELSPEEATRIRKKIDWHILPLMCSE